MPFLAPTFDNADPLFPLVITPGFYQHHIEMEYQDPDSGIQVEYQDPVSIIKYANSSIAIFRCMLKRRNTFIFNLVQYFPNIIKLHFSAMVMQKNDFKYKKNAHCLLLKNTTVVFFYCKGAAIS